MGLVAEHEEIGAPLQRPQQAEDEGGAHLAAEGGDEHEERVQAAHQRDGDPDGGLALQVAQQCEDEEGAAKADGGEGDGERLLERLRVAVVKVELGL